MAVQKNDKIELMITGISSEGFGIGRVEGFCIFVPNAIDGDWIIARIVKVLKKFAFAKIEDILSPSPHRISSACHVFQQCGGCSFQQMQYDKECQVKQQRVIDAFQRIGHITTEVSPIIAADNPDFYRNKAQYPVQKEKGGIKIGFYAPHSHRIIDNSQCRLQPIVFSQILALCRTWIEQENITCYDEKNGRGLIRHIYLRCGMATGEIMVCFVVNGNNLPGQEKLIPTLTGAFPTIKSIVLNCNSANTNVILGKTCKTLWGQPYITDILCGCKFRISPLTFYQVNHAQAEKLYRLAASYAGLTGTQTVLDLYCGAGTIGLTTAKHAKQVIGVEIIPQAIADAKINAELNGITNAEFLCGDAAAAAKSLEERKIFPDVVLLDPPRKGCDSSLIATIVRMSPPKVVYVSCDPATLARDLAQFAEQGYQIDKATPVDMFPRTPHVETVVLLKKAAV